MIPRKGSRAQRLYLGHGFSVICILPSIPSTSILLPCRWGKHTHRFTVSCKELQKSDYLHSVDLPKGIDRRRVSLEALEDQKLDRSGKHSFGQGCSPNITYPWGRFSKMGCALFFVPQGILQHTQCFSVWHHFKCQQTHSAPTPRLKGL